MEIEARIYTPDDLPMLRQWAEFHGRELATEVLPPLGVIVSRDGEPEAALFVYLSVGVGVAFLEHAITRPMLSAKKTRESLMHATTAILAAAREQGEGYNVFIAYTVPAIARTLNRNGWKTTGQRESLCLLT